MHVFGQVNGGGGKGGGAGGNTRFQQDPLTGLVCGPNQGVQFRRTHGRRNGKFVAAAHLVANMRIAGNKAVESGRHGENMARGFLALEYKKLPGKVI